MTSCRSSRAPDNPTRRSQVCYAQSTSSHKDPARPDLSLHSDMVRTAFVLIDVQEGFKDPDHWGPERSNPSFERNAAQLLTGYRELVQRDPAAHLLIHVQHASQIPSSRLHPCDPGFAFQAFAQPLSGEKVVVKGVNSAFIGTDLEQILREHFAGVPGRLYIAGLSTDHCVSTTTRMAGNLEVAGQGGKVLFVTDATAAWKKTADSQWDAEMVHAVHAESLREFATIVQTADVLEEWA